jgi:hypothetical protein
MRKFKGSKIIAGGVVLLAAFYPYWYSASSPRIYRNHYGKQIVIDYDLKLASTTNTNSK